MTETIQYEQFDQDPREGPTYDSASAELARLGEVPMELSVELGRTRMTVAQTLELRAGAVVALERPAGLPADLLVNGTPIARGEVVVVDEHYGLRISEILDPQAGAPGAEQSPQAPAIDGAAEPEAATVAASV